MSKRILIVDDDRRLCQELASSLKEEGYVTEYTFDRIHGEALVIQNQYDIILLDVKTPNANGFDMLREIKQLRPEVAVVLVTGRPLIEKLIGDENVSSLIAGFLKKPFSVEKLFAKIKTL